MAYISSVHIIALMWCVLISIDYSETFPAEVISDYDNITFPDDGT
jgi:hypothetical protein